MKLIVRKKKHKENRNFLDISAFQGIKFVGNFIPPKPPKTCGFMEKMGLMIFNFNLRFIELDALEGTFKRFKNLEDYPNKPQ